MPLAVVSERLGHSDQNITLSIYSHAIPADTKAAAKIWNDAMADVIAESRKAGAERRLANVCTRTGESPEVFETKRKRMAGTTGLEPATSDVTGRRSARADICASSFLGNSSTPIEFGISSKLGLGVRRPSFEFWFRKPTTEPVGFNVWQHRTKRRLGKF